MSRTSWSVATILALALSFTLAVRASGAATAPPAAEPVLGAAITLVTSGNLVELTADPGAGDVELTATNATMTVECGGGGCPGLTGQGTSHVTIPAGAGLSDVTITLNATGSQQPSLTARQGGATAMVSTGFSSTSLSGGTTTYAGEAASAGLLAGRGLALFVFAGGTFEDLVDSTGCPASRLALWATDGRGGFLLFVPGSLVEAVNRAFRDFYADGVLPAYTPLIGRCG